MEAPETGNDAPAFAAIGILALVVLLSITLYLLLSSG
jgi:LPXTG-motif cell wall-anchored protein